jgi:hypothetical protein
MHTRYSMQSILHGACKAQQPWQVITRIANYMPLLCWVVMCYAVLCRMLCAGARQPDQQHG